MSCGPLTLAAPHLLDRPAPPDRMLRDALAGNRVLHESIAPIAARLAALPGVEPGRTRREREFRRHDGYYGIRRIDREAWTALAVGAVTTAWRLGPNGPRSLVAALLQVAGSAATEIGDPAPDSSDRWMLGHQIFAVLMQGLLAVTANLINPKAHNPATDLASLALLFRASGTALRYTGRVSPRHYRDNIRPAMPAGFSGLMAADHHHLLGRLRAARPILTQLAPDHPAELDEVRQAWAAAYAEHINVCTRLVGPWTPSLLATEHGPSATDSLRHYRQLRLRTIPGGMP